MYECIYLFTMNALLPYNLLAEQSVLSILINNPSLLDEAQIYLSEESFYFFLHKTIYQSLTILKANNKIINSTTLITYLQDQNLLEQIGGIKEVLNLTQQRESVVYLKPYLNLINEKFLRRNLIAIGEKLIEWGYLTQQPIEKLLEEAEHEIFQLSHNHMYEKTLTTAELLVDTLEELKFSTNSRESKGYLTHYEDLDSILQGFQNTDLIILAGRPSMGKTALALNLGKNIAEFYNYPVIFFSLEMSKKQIMYRLLSLESFVDSTRLRLGKITKKEWTRVLKAARQLAAMPLYIEDNSVITLTQMRSKIKRISFDYKKIALVIIDYLQLIRTNLKLNNRVQEISYITRTLKALAKEFDLPILVLSQLSRNVESRVNKRPILSDLRESGCSTRSRNVQSFNGFSLLNWEPTGYPLYYSFKPCYNLKSSNLSIYSSSNHKFFCQQGWLKTREICYLIRFLRLNKFFKFYSSSLRNSLFLNFPSQLRDITIPDGNIVLNEFLSHNSIEQDADIVLMIYRDEYYKRATMRFSLKTHQAEVIIAKHRNGPVGFIELFFDSRINKFFSSDS